MTIVKLIANAFGLTGTGYLLYFRVGGGWHANALWLVMGLFWLVNTGRACMKLYFEYKEGQIELEEKRRRYKEEKL